MFVNSLFGVFIWCGSLLFPLQLPMRTLDCCVYILLQMHTARDSGNEMMRMRERKPYTRRNDELKQSIDALSTVSACGKKITIQMIPHLCVYFHMNICFCSQNTAANGGMNHTQTHTHTTSAHTITKHWARIQIHIDTRTHTRTHAHTLTNSSTKLWASVQCIRTHSVTANQYMKQAYEHDVFYETGRKETNSYFVGFGRYKYSDNIWL